MSYGGPVVDTNLGPPPSAAPNPLAQAGDFMRMGMIAAETQNLRNQNILFQHTMAARQKLGATLAMSPDLQTGLQKASQDPTLTAFVPDILQTLQATQQSAMATRGLDLSQVHSALGIARELAAVGISDPSKLPEAQATVMAALPPGLKKEVGPAIADLYTSFTNGADASTPEGQAKIKQNIISNLTGAGISTPAFLYALGGGMAATPQGQPGGGTQMIGGPRSLAPGWGQNPPGAPVGRPPQASGAGAQVMAEDGQPLYAPDSAILRHKIGVNGQPIFSSQQDADRASQEFRDFVAETPHYRENAVLQGQLDTMVSEFKGLAKNGTWATTPGADSTVRANLGNLVNTIWRIAKPGEAPPIDPNSYASAEALQKDAERLGFAGLSAMFRGRSGEGLGTLEHSLRAIPNAERSPLGGVVIAQWMKAATQWKADEQKYISDWASRNNGDIRNAQNTFLNQHDPMDYLRPVLESHGIGPDGYMHDTDVVRDFNENLIDRQTLLKIAKAKGWAPQDAK